MKMTREKALKIKEAADAYLLRLEKDEASQTKMLANKYEDIMRGVNKLISTVSQTNQSEKILAGLKLLKVDLGNAIKAMSPDMTPLIRAVQSLEYTVRNQKQPEVGVVQSIEKLGKLIGSGSKPKETADRTDELLEAIKSIKIDVPKLEFPKSISVDNFPIQKYPNPVTHISINSLNGSVKTSAVSVTTSATQLPSTSLAGRRSIMVYNNDASTTLFIGGSDVTTTNGMPVPANSYSPILDAGDELDVYGISTGTINVRVLEIGDEDMGR